MKAGIYHLNELDSTMLRPIGLALLLLAAAGCMVMPTDSEDGVREGSNGEAGAASADSSPAGAPIQVRLSVADMSALFSNGSPATVEIRAVGEDAKNVRAGLRIFGDVEVRAGSFSYSGDVATDSPVLLDGVLRARPEGEHVLRAWAESFDWGRTAAWAAPSALIGVRWAAGSAETFVPTYTPPMFDIALQESEDDPLDVTAQMASEFSSDASARVWISVPPAHLRESSAQWEGILPSGGTQIRYVIDRGMFAADGVWSVSVTLFPDPSLDGRRHHAELFYTVSGNEISVSHTDPTRPSATGASGPSGSPQPTSPGP